MPASRPTRHPAMPVILTLTLSPAKGNAEESPCCRPLLRCHSDTEHREAEESPHFARVAAPLRLFSPFEVRTPPHTRAPIMYEVQS